MGARLGGCSCTPHPTLRLQINAGGPYAAQVELTGAMWPTPRTFSEHHLLLLVEALAAAGASCQAFLAEAGPEPELAHPSLLLALGRPAWGPAQHARWPPRFRAAARAFLLAARARGAAAAGADEGRRGRGRQRICLPRELCCMVLAAASRPLSSWV